jgi:hypothetical protein
MLNYLFRKERFTFSNYTLYACLQTQTVRGTPDAYQITCDEAHNFVTAGLHSCVNEVFTLLRCYTALIGG